MVVPPGPNLTEALKTSAIVQGEDGYTPAGGDFGAGFDVDPNLDPELALVSYYTKVISLNFYTKITTFVH